MKRPFLTGLFCLIALAVQMSPEGIRAADLLRGPFLQIATSDRITIRWRTDEPTESVVYYGTQAEPLPLTDLSLSKTTEHEVELNGLSPDTRYFYAVGSLTEKLAEGPEYFFVTAPPRGQSKPTRIWIVGDCGTANTGAGNQIGVRDAYYNYAGFNYTDIMLALGDNAYYSGTDQEYQHNFFDIYQRIFRQTPLWSTVGNHETYSSTGNGRFPYLDIFSFPTEGEAGGVASGTEKYYSFDYANIHFISLDSMTSLRIPGGDMLQWLEADLAANTNEWVIAYFHHPPYTKGSHNSDLEIEHIQMRQNAIPILEAHGVDLVLSGHSHIYERSYLLHGHYGSSSTLIPSMILDSGSGQPGDTGPYRKSVSGFGASRGAVYVVAGSSGWATFRTGHHPVMFVDPLQMGSLVVDIHTNRLDAVFLRETGAIEDSFTIIKGDSDELRLSSFRIHDGKAIAHWRSVPGQAYRIERTLELEGAEWSVASASIVATDATTSWTNAIAGGSKAGFFRVVTAD